MAPGQRAELLTALPRRAYKGDRGIVDREGVGLQGAGRFLGTEQARSLGESARRHGDLHPGLGRIPEVTGRAGADRVSDQACGGDPPQDPLAPALAVVGEVDRANLGERERPVLGNGGDDLDARPR